MGSAAPDDGLPVPDHAAGSRGRGRVGRRVRELHKSIKGTKPDGRPITRSSPRPTPGCTRHSSKRPFAPPEVHRADERLEVDRFYARLVPLGRLLGVRPGDLPEDWDGFRDYFRTMSHDRLERNETVDDVVATLSAKEPPPVPGLKQLWPILRLAPARAVRVATIGMLRPPLRERFGLEWTRRDMLEFRLMQRASRAATPLLPKRLTTEMGERHLAWRRREIAAGPLGAGSGRGLRLPGRSRRRAVGRGRHPSSVRLSRDGHQQPLHPRARGGAG